MSKAKLFQRLLKDTAPVLAGYLFLGGGFGILMQQSGYSIFLVIAMSITILSGSIQYMAVGMMNMGTGLLTVAFTTFFVNVRYLFYGISTVDTYKGAGMKKPYMLFGMTDETFAIVSKGDVPEGLSPHTYYFLVTLFDHSYWIIGSVIGCLAGSLIPISFEGIDFVLTALFVTIFVEQWLSTKNHIPALLGIFATLLSLLLFGSEIFLIPAMLTITLCLLGMKRVGGKGGDAE